MLVYKFTLNVAYKAMLVYTFAHTKHFVNLLHFVNLFSRRLYIMFVINLLLDIYTSILCINLLQEFSFGFIFGFTF